MLEVHVGFGPWEFKSPHGHALVVEWQTRLAQTQVRITGWEFDSPSAYDNNNNSLPP